MHGHAHMHGAGICGKKQGTAPEKPRKNRKADFPCEYMDPRTLLFLHIGKTFFNDGHIGRTAKKSNLIPLADKTVRAGGKVCVNPAFCQPACADIERNHPIL